MAYAFQCDLEGRPIKLFGVVQSYPDVLRVRPQTKTYVAGIRRPTVLLKIVVSYIYPNIGSKHYDACARRFSIQYSKYDPGQHDHQIYVIVNGGGRLSSAQQKLFEPLPVNFIHHTNQGKDIGAYQMISSSGPLLASRNPPISQPTFDLIKHFAPIIESSAACSELGAPPLQMANTSVGTPGWNCFHVETNRATKSVVLGPPATSV